jgi:hypothetical protein
MTTDHFLDDLLTTGLVSTAIDLVGRIGGLVVWTISPSLIEYFLRKAIRLTFYY